MSLLRGERGRIALAFEGVMLVVLAAEARCSAGGTEISIVPDASVPDTQPEDADVLDAAMEGDSADAAADAGLCAPVRFYPATPDGCGEYYDLACGLPEGATPRADCFLDRATCEAVCPSLFFNCRAAGPSCVDGGVVPGDGGMLRVDCVTCLNGAGRVPAGLHRPPDCGLAADGVTRYLERAAHLEAASIVSFRRLARELRVLGAPEELMSAARCAAREEARHARVLGSMARARGGAPPRVVVAAQATRSLFEVALENAVEGCVRETFGALVAHHQADHAGESQIADAMREIAADEERHATLSWAIARWTLPRLSHAERARIARACRDASVELQATRDAAGEGVGEALGLPTPQRRVRMAKALTISLFGELAAA